jgi:ABC-type polysaccharide/polyol phosphate export permease
MATENLVAAAYYDSADRGSPMMGEFTELLRYRDLLRLLIGKIIKTRYKRSALGVVWAVLNPLLTMAVMTIAFSALFKGAVPNYPLYILTGLICWNFFSQTTAYAMSSLVWGGGLLRRVYIPRTIFAVASVGHGLVNLALTMLPLLVIMLFMRHAFHATWWFVPFAVLLLALFALGVALFMSTLAVFFVDVLDLYQVFLQAWFFLTPIMYPENILPAQYAWILRFNPMHYLLELFRAPILLGSLPSAGTILAACAWTLGTLAVGWFTLARKADEFAYRL